MAEVNSRPNIRIEIKNNVNETMDIDEEAINISEDEEGEIVEKNGEQDETVSKPRDIWAKFDNLPANNNTDVKSQIESVYTSLNVKELRDTVRLDAIHMRQVGEMNTLDILKYFLAFSPTAIEWVDEKSCNILWADMPLAAKALYHLSQAIVGSKHDGSLEETMDLDGQNNGMQNKHRIIEIKDEDKEMDKETDKENSKEIHIRDLKEDIPEGNWRLGNENVKCKFILLRFALTTDKHPVRAEHFTEYYKQCGVIENGTKLGIISQSRKRKFQGIFDRNRDLISSEHVTNKNPWGTLAESWNQDYVHTESEYQPSTLLTSKRLESVSSLHHRLGFKRAHLDTTENNENNLDNIDDENEQENVEEIIEIRSDLEDTIASVEQTSRQLLEKRLKHKSSKKKKSKVPRMRMYADEEEAKIKRKKSLQSMKKKLSQKKKPAEEIVEEERIDANDLRNMLGKRTILKPKRRIENMLLVIKQESDEDERNSGRQMEDLGNKLKHRHLMRLSEAAAKNSIHLHSHGIQQMVSTSYHDEETYDMQAPEPEQHRHSRTMRSENTKRSSTSSFIPRGATLHSDTVTRQSRHQSITPTPTPQHRTNVRSPERNQQQHHYRKEYLRGDREGRDFYQREHRHRDMDQRGSRHEAVSHGRMHADREEYHGRRSGTRGDIGGERRAYRRHMEEEEIDKVERKGAKSKVMVVVKKQYQHAVASMAILPSTTVSQHHAQPTSISTSNLRHRRHDNVRLTTRDSNRPSSSSSSSSEGNDSSSSSSSSSSEEDDDGSSSESGSASESDSDSESSSSSESEESKRNGKTVVRGGRGSIKDRVGVRREDAQPGRLRVQIKNEHYGK